jgi:hypothetical protein
MEPTDQLDAPNRGFPESRAKAVCLNGKPSYLHGHSALSRASSRRSGGKRC